MNLKSKAEFVKEMKTVVIRDLDETISAEDVKQAIKKKIGDETQIYVKLTEKEGERGNTLAFADVPTEKDNPLLRQKIICIRWRSCRIEEKITIKRSYKCLQFGHFAYQCKAENVAMQVMRYHIVKTRCTAMHAKLLGTDQIT